MGQIQSPIIDLGGNPEPFIYIEPIDNVVDCRDAVKAHPNVTRTPFGGSDMPLCGDNGCAPRLSGPCDPERNLKSALDSKAELTAELSAVQNEKGLGTTGRTAIADGIKRCLRNVNGILFELLMEEGRYPEARALFNGEETGQAMVEIYSSFIHENDLEGARKYLNSIPASSEEWSDFKFIQNINLDRLPLGPYYIPSEATVTAVRTIAEKSNSLSAYAKALYYALTGEVIISPLPDIMPGELNSRSSLISAPGEYKVNVYPNPFDKFLNIETEGLKQCTVIIRDACGKACFHQVTDRNRLSIDTQNWKPGLYFAEVFSDKEIVSLQKILLFD